MLLGGTDVLHHFRNPFQSYKQTMGGKKILNCADVEWSNLNITLESLAKLLIPKFFILQCCRAHFYLIGFVSCRLSSSTSVKKNDCLILVSAIFQSWALKFVFSFAFSLADEIFWKILINLTNEYISVLGFIWMLYNNYNEKYHQFFWITKMNHRSIFWAPRWISHILYNNGSIVNFQNQQKFSKN